MRYVFHRFQIKIVCIHRPSGVRSTCECFRRYRREGTLGCSTARREPSDGSQRAAANLAAPILQSFLFSFCFLWSHSFHPPPCFHLFFQSGCCSAQLLARSELDARLDRMSARPPIFPTLFPDVTFSNETDLSRRFSWRPSTNSRKETDFRNNPST